MKKHVRTTGHARQTFVKRQGLGVSVGILLLAPILALQGCSWGQPSEAEFLKAAQASIDRQQAPCLPMMGTYVQGAVQSALGGLPAAWITIPASRASGDTARLDALAAIGMLKKEEVPLLQQDGPPQAGFRFTLTSLGWAASRQALPMACLSVGQYKVKQIGAASAAPSAPTGEPIAKTAGPLGDVYAARVEAELVDMPAWANHAAVQAAFSKELTALKAAASRTVRLVKIKGHWEDEESIAESLRIDAQIKSSMFKKDLEAIAAADATASAAATAAAAPPSDDEILAALNRDLPRLLIESQTTVRSLSQVSDRARLVGPVSSERPVAYFEPDALVEPTDEERVLQERRGALIAERGKAFTTDRSPLNEEINATENALFKLKSARQGRHREPNSRNEAIQWFEDLSRIGRLRRDVVGAEEGTTERPAGTYYWPISPQARGDISDSLMPWGTLRAAAVLQDVKPALGLSPAGLAGRLFAQLGAGVRTVRVQVERSAADPAAPELRDPMLRRWALSKRATMIVTVRAGMRPGEPASSSSLWAQVSGPLNWEPLDESAVMKPVPPADLLARAGDPGTEGASPAAVVPGASGTKAARCSLTDLQLPKDLQVFAAGSDGGQDLEYPIDNSGSEAKQLELRVHADKPVGLLLSAYGPTVWNIRWTPGTQIVAVYATGYHRAAVAGLPKSVPVISTSHDPKGACGDESMHSEETPAWLNPRSLSVFGREVTRLYNTSKNGVIDIVESRRSVGPYQTSSDVPPASFFDMDAPRVGQLGVMDAVRKGTLRLATDQDERIVLEAFRARKARQSPGWVPPVADTSHQDERQLLGAPFVRGSYVVLGAFTYPAGLHGGQAVSFLILKGMPKPKGDPGHSRVVNLNDI